MVKLYTNKKMKAILVLLFVVLIPAKYASAQRCPVEDAIDAKISAAIDSKVSILVPELSCTSVSARGADVSCPSDYKATGCACGMACGSWDIRGETQCHCQCANIDWTSARCCKVVLSGGFSG
ncbi:resistin isoform X1 [Anolis carolinensis]|uniref:resistin isoform X1 n=1 Tax=Anolis carolinensis TaxID=28377 RepID=UPI00046276A8|nr:PREDICTED: resistin isoform X1 [Anolis carolinensis]|eukprot:XP_008102432.1 PREDICTED: resistin isoform X1 [Anolis carolinensis]